MASNTVGTINRVENELAVLLGLINQRQIAGTEFSPEIEQLNKIVRKALSDVQMTVLFPKS